MRRVEELNEREVLAEIERVTRIIAFYAPLENDYKTERETLRNLFYRLDVIRETIKNEKRTAKGKR